MADFDHKSVMLAEVLAALGPRPGGSYTDGTLGGGGHAAAILAASSPTGWLFGCDRDGDALEAARARLAEFEGRFEMRRGNFDELAQWIRAGSCDGVLLDLGASSMQLNVPDRGFSFQHDGPLDMRMDRRQALTAADLVNHSNAEELADLFWKFGGERESRRFARAIVSRRESGKAEFRTTRQLAEVIESCVAGSRRTGRRTHPATKVFQALRMAVNDEIGSLKRGLAAALEILKSGGRLAVISFHSVEDRAVKEFARERARDYSVTGGVDVPELRQARTPEVKLITRKAIKPTAAEIEENPRARSAQLRVMEKC